MPHIPIDPQRKYKPMEITQYGFILNTKGKPDYRYVLRLITLGRIKAEFVATGEKGKMFFVTGQDIINWKKSTTQFQPEKKETPYTFRNKPFPQAE